jgi:hypothetical protein
MNNEIAEQKTTIIWKTWQRSRAAVSGVERAACRKKECNLKALMRFYGSKFLLRYSILKIKSKLKLTAGKLRSLGMSNRKVLHSS